MFESYIYLIISGKDAESNIDSVVAIREETPEEKRNDDADVISEHTDLAEKNSNNLEYQNLLKLYTDLLIEYQELKNNCQCHNLKSNDNRGNDNINMNDKITVDGSSFIYKNIISNEPMFTLNRFKHSDKDIFYYTGFTSFTILQKCLHMLFEFGNENLLKMHNSSSVTGKSRIRQHQMNREDEFFLVLIKLRQNFGYEHLSKLFNVSVATVSNIFISWINFIYVRLGSIDIWAHRDIILSHASNEFIAKYPNVIGSLDATEIYVQTPISLLLQSQTYSQYKHNNTLKGLVAVDCNGSIIFISALFTGAISDNALLEKSGFNKVVESKISEGFLLHGDTFLADKGFTATELLKPVNISIPVFKINNVQFSPNEVHHTQKIARERVHVERAIGRIKNYKILGSEVALAQLGTFNQIWTVCCLLSNFQKPLRPVKTNFHTS